MDEKKLQPQYPLLSEKLHDGSEGMDDDIQYRVQIQDTHVQDKESWESIVPKVSW